MIGSRRSGLKRGHDIFAMFHLSPGHECDRLAMHRQAAARLNVRVPKDLFRASSQLGVLCGTLRLKISEACSLSPGSILNSIMERGTTRALREGVVRAQSAIFPAGGQLRCR